jgi:Family of unknown function (DUF6232)
MSQQETEYYQSADVLVTNARVEMGGRTFAMANVTAVSIATMRSPLRGFPLGIFLGGGLITLAGLFAIGNEGGAVLLPIGLMIAIAGYAWWKTFKPSYFLNLSSTSGELRAMQSHNREEIEQIVAAIKQAMVNS